MTNLKQQALGELLKNYRALMLDKMDVSGELKETMYSLANMLLTPTFSPKSLGLTYATIKYWEQKEYLILPIPKETDEWRKFCPLEFLWIQILKKLSTMGCAMDIIVPKLKFAYNNKFKHSEIIQYDFINPINSNHSIGGIHLTATSTFLIHTIAIITFQNKAALHFFDRYCQFVYETEVDKLATANIAYEAMYSSGISICISDFIHEFTMQKDKLLATKKQAFTAQELEIISLLNKNQLKEITIKLENGEPVSFEIKENYKIPNKKYGKRLKEFLNTPYQEIRAITNNDKSIYIESTTKHKFKK